MRPAVQGFRSRTLGAFVVAAVGIVCLLRAMPANAGGPAAVPTGVLPAGVARMDSAALNQADQTVTPRSAP